MKNKKTRRKMKKQVRKTFGAVFLASAVAIAAIPTTSYEGGSANAASVPTGNNSVTLDIEAQSKNGGIPLFLTQSEAGSKVANIIDRTNVDTSTPKIYTNGEGTYRFAVYTDYNNDSQNVAVVLGYNGLAPENFVIENTMDAYRIYGGMNYPCAISANGENYLFYSTVETVQDTRLVQLQQQQEAQKQEKDAAGNYLFFVDESKKEKTSVETHFPVMLYYQAKDNLKETDQVTPYPVMQPLYYTDASKTKTTTNKTEYPYMLPVWYTDSSKSATTTKPGPDELKVMVEETYYTDYPTYSPCYYNEFDRWKEADEASGLYYYPENDTSKAPLPAVGEEHVRCKGLPVRYIGNQYLQASSDGFYYVAGTAHSPETGAFAANLSSVTSISFNDNLYGIGDYAFASCSSLLGASFQYYLKTIGNHCFSDCISLRTVDIPINSAISLIGPYAFYNCASLQSFSVPINVRQIGDFAFANCRSITNIQLDGGEGAMAVLLSKIGYHAFENCSSLAELSFPKGFTQTLDICVIKGCSSLKRIYSPEKTFRFQDSDDQYCSYAISEHSKGFSGIAGDSFASELDAVGNQGFYLEGQDDSDLHTLAKNHSFAFKYSDKDLFEKKIVDAKDASKSALFAVNSKNELISCELDGISELVIPGEIGPYAITSLTSGFRNNCELKTVTIPQTVTNIGEAAFMGCHNLTTVYFENVNTIGAIGERAFDTQDYTGKHTCKEGTIASGTPELYFVGPISDNKAFQYAMNPSNNIETGSQTADTYITYCSGWPTNLVVRYNKNTGKNELIDYPTVEGLSSSTIATSSSPATGYYRYPYITSAYQSAISGIIADYNAYERGEMSSISAFGKQALDAIINLELPSQITGVAWTTDGTEKVSLFTQKEQKELDYTDAYGTTNRPQKNFTAYGLGRIENKEFAECDTFVSVTLAGSETDRIGDYAFGNCKNLSNLIITNSVTDMGRRPFTGCDSLEEISFLNGSVFSTENGLLFQNGPNGKKLIEYLEGRSVGAVPASELTGTVEFAAEAFAGTDVTSVDLSDTTVKTIPDSCFQYTPDLYSVRLNYGLTSINKDAFSDCGIRQLELPATVVVIDTDAFNNTVAKTSQAPNPKAYIGAEGDYTNLTNLGKLTFVCPENAINPRAFAETKGIKVSDSPVVEYYEVKFWNPDGTELLYTASMVLSGTSVSVNDLMENELLVVPEVEGKKFIGFVPETAYVSVVENGNCYAKYEDLDLTHKIVFVDGLKNEVIDTQVVLPGDKVYVPTPAQYEDYTFSQWLPSVPAYPIDRVSEADCDVTYTSVYYPAGTNLYTVKFYKEDKVTLINSITKVEHSSLTDAEFPVPPTESGKVFSGWWCMADGDTNALMADITKDISFIATYTSKVHTCIFIDHDLKELVKRSVFDGESVEPPNDPVREGYTFTGWYPDDFTNITEDHKYIAMYEKIDSASTDVKVTFCDDDGETVLFEQTVRYGGSVVNPGIPEKEGYVFTGWLPNTLTNLTSDVTVYAQYEVKKKPYIPDDSGSIGGIGGGSANSNPGGSSDGSMSTEMGNQLNTDLDSTKPNNNSGSSDGNNGNTGNNSNSGNTGNTNNNTGNTTPGNNGNTTPGSDSGNTNNNTGSNSGTNPAPAPKYTLTVVNGSGSGTYEAGAQAIIVANDPQPGYEFNQWTISPENTKIASYGLSATVVTMPSSNVTVTAVYKAKTAGGNNTNTGTNTNNGSNTNTGSNSNTGSNTGAQTPSNSAKPTPGSTVVIDKNGLSNTAVVSATVNGSSDNFIIKVAEQADASEAVVKALIDSYGDISNLVYFPMDISLYDSTGTTKITDTTGLSVTITLPIPDSMVQYGGNNRAAAVKNGSLEPLNAKFTTISGVPCITFTATHFSPYMLYVDTANLSAQGAIDSTPKTADGIHPKWFLSLGLFAMSMVLFLKKDKKTLRKVSA